jgi:colanic acid/amylovoran biosynthesis glycosyltransferase
VPELDLTSVAGPRRIAYVLTEFPALTETFVTTECTLLERRAIEVRPFSLRRPTHATVGPETLGWRRRTGYAGHTSPWAFGGSAARRALAIASDHLRLAPVEGAFAARVLPAAAWIAERARAVDHIHTHFERGAAILASLVAAFLDRPWSFTAHAFGVYLSAPRALGYRCRQAAFVRVSHRSLDTRLHALAGPAPGLRTVLARTPLPPDFTVATAPTTPPGPDAPIVVVARDVPKKGLDLLPDIARELRRLGHERRIEVIGPTGRRVPTWATGAVVHQGPLPHADIRRRLEDAALSLLPCRIAPNGDRDGLPLSLLESMAVGTPAVSTRVGGIPEAYPGALGGLLAAPEDTVEIARAVARVLESADVRRELATLGLDVIARDYGPGALDPLVAAFGETVSPLP